MICNKKNIFLIFSILYLLLINKDIFIDTFHGIKLAGELIDDQRDSSERPLVNDLDDFEVIQL